MNYLNDAMDINFTKAEDYVISSTEHLNSSDRVTICGKCYQDPDKRSIQLYNDMSRYFKYNDKRLSCTKKGEIYLYYDKDDNHKLSTDYIGPSRAFAMKYLGNELSLKEKSKIIGDYLLITRTIGGHVFWPKKQCGGKTINQVKGGTRGGIYDRFDITLGVLKYFFEKQIEKKDKVNQSIIYKPLYNAFLRYKWFFEEYENFDNYVNNMKLDMFLHEGEVFSLVYSDVEKEEYVRIEDNNYEPIDYIRYITNCKNLISKRTNKILEEQR